jgi:hypothetical protein
MLGRIRPQLPRRDAGIIKLSQRHLHTAAYSARASRERVLGRVATLSGVLERRRQRVHVALLLVQHGAQFGAL